MSRDGIATKLASDNSEQKKRAVSLLYRVDSVLRLDSDPFISLDFQVVVPSPVSLLRWSRSLQLSPLDICACPI